LRRTNSRSTLFLGEVVLALLIFALSAAVCVGLLFRSYNISETSSELNQAVFCVQSAAEAFKAQPKLEKVAAILGGDIQLDRCYVYYNEDWLKTGKEDAAFTMLITPRFEAGVNYATISLSNGAGPIFELTTAVYEGEGGQ